MIVEFATDWVEPTLFLVTTQEDGHALVAAGIGRGRIIGPGEVALARLLDKEARKAALEIKVTYDAKLYDVVTR